MRQFLAMAFTAIIASSALLVMTSSASAHRLGVRHSHSGISVGIYGGGVTIGSRYHRHHRRHHRRHFRRSYRSCFGHGCYQPRYRYYEPYYGHRRVYRERIIIYERAPRRDRKIGRVHRGNRHVRWCYKRFRSYRSADNTFQPYHGRRRACRSPYY